MDGAFQSCSGNFQQRPFRNDTKAAGGIIPITCARGARPQARSPLSFEALGALGSVERGGRLLVAKARLKCSCILQLRVTN